jgi:hypothetical protein
LGDDHDSLEKFLCGTEAEKGTEGGRRYLEATSGYSRQHLTRLIKLPEAEQNLKQGVRLSDLREEARRLTDNQAAERMRTARAALFQEILHARKVA